MANEVEKWKDLFHVALEQVSELEANIDQQVETASLGLERTKKECEVRLIEMSEIANREAEIGKAGAKLVDRVQELKSRLSLERERETKVCDAVEHLRAKLSITWNHVDALHNAVTGKGQSLTRYGSTSEEVSSVLLRLKEREPSNTEREIYAELLTANAVDVRMKQVIERAQNFEDVEIERLNIELGVVKREVDAKRNELNLQAERYKLEESTRLIQEREVEKGRSEAEVTILSEISRVEEELVSSKKEKECVDEEKDELIQRETNPNPNPNPN